MTSLPLHFTVLGDDFTCAGEASSKVKNKLKQLGTTLKQFKSCHCHV
ncbi:MAG: hypothetical protein ACLR13_09410 [Acutalibacteraceae bacterium]